MKQKLLSSKTFHFLLAAFFALHPLIAWTSIQNYIIPTNVLLGLIGITFICICGHLLLATGHRGRRIAMGVFLLGYVVLNAVGLVSFLSNYD